MLILLRFDLANTPGGNLACWRLQAYAPLLLLTGLATRIKAVPVRGLGSQRTKRPQSRQSSLA
jgi:hypothetical protein